VRRPSNLIGRCSEAQGNDEKAFAEYQRLLEKYPRLPNYEEVLKRQYEIAAKFLAGKWFRLWGYVPFFPSMERTADMYAKIVKKRSLQRHRSAVSVENRPALMRTRKLFGSRLLITISASKLTNLPPIVTMTADHRSRSDLPRCNAYNKQARTAE